jgi:uncharacterized C2H2 Zn-finger protein
MIIRCRVCGKEFDKNGQRTRHELDAHGYKKGKAPRGAK